MDSSNSTTSVKDGVASPSREESEDGSESLLILESPETSFTIESQANSRLPALPVEVIERILKYTFSRPSKLLPTSEATHLVGTSYLLRLSKGFRELCLPIFYQSITISRPSHYLAFFDPPSGIFAGEEGKKLWSFVKELAIVIGVEPPVVSDPHRHPTYLVPLLVPNIRRLTTLCLLNGVASTTNDVDRTDVLNLFSSGMEDEEWGDAVHSALGSSNKSLGINIRSHQEVSQALHQERQLFRVHLISRASPVEVVVASGPLKHLKPSSWTVAEPATTLSLYSSEKETSDFSLGSFLGTIELTQEVFGTVARTTRLRAFPSSAFKGFSSWLGRSDRGHGWRVKWIKAVESWTWEMEDGEVVLLDAIINPKRT